MLGSLPTVTRRDATDDGVVLRSVHRFDRGELRPMERTPEGFLMVEGFIARPGVMEYRTSDGGSVRELIEEVELHDAVSLGSLAMKPVTNDHPTEDVTPDNAARLSVGAVDPEIDVVKIGGFVRIRFVVQNRDAIDAIDSGKRELSPGYRCEIDPTPGTHPVYGRYDARQLRRRYNHAAIVDRARGGSEIRLRADSAQQTTPPTAPPLSTEAFMHPSLVALLTLLGVSRFDDEKIAVAEGLTLLRKRDAEESAAAAATEPKVEVEVESPEQKAAKSGAGGAMSLDEIVSQRDVLQKQVDELVKQVDAYKAKQAEADTAAAAEGDKKDRAELDSLCDRLRVAKKDDACSLADYSVYVAAEAGVTLPKETPKETLRGVITGLSAQVKARADGADAYDPWADVGLRRDADKADAAKVEAEAEAKRKADGAPPSTGSAFLDNIAKRFPHGARAAAAK